MWKEIVNNRTLRRDDAPSLLETVQVLKPLPNLGF